MSDQKRPPGYIPLTMHELGGIDGNNGRGGRRQRPNFGDDFYYGDSSDFSTRPRSGPGGPRRGGGGGGGGDDQRNNSRYSNGRHMHHQGGGGPNGGSRRRRKGRRGGRGRFDGPNQGPMREDDQFLEGGEGGGNVPDGNSGGQQNGNGADREGFDGEDDGYDSEGME